MTTALELDPAITDDEVAAAHEPGLGQYHHDEPQDDLDELGAGTVVPATPVEALAHAKALTDDDVYVGVGYCLRTVRDPEYRVPALWPDAETAWEEADGKHPTADPAAIPRGAVVYWTNGRHGHVALSVGGGLCRTTDYRRPGYVDLAPIAALAAWCGGRLVGWAEELNGVDVWPHIDTAPRKPRALSLEDRIVVVRRALHRAQAHHAPQVRRDGLAEWLDQLEARLANRKK